MDKRVTQQRFNAASHSYERVALIQKECAKVLINELSSFAPDFYPESILDLGTGTGYVPELLLPMFPNGRYSLNDLAPDMLTKAQAKFQANPQFKFYLGDCESLDFAYHDLIISNLALQWIKHLHELLVKLYLNSKFLVFTCLLKGTFLEWERLLANYNIASPLKNYPSFSQLEEFVASLKAHKYKCFERKFGIEFANTKAFMLYLRELGASVGTGPVPNLRRILQENKTNFQVSYQVFFGILQRE